MSLLCACGDGGSSSSADDSAQGGKPEVTAQQGNESAFNLSESHLQSVLACAWVNQNDFNEKIKFLNLIKLKVNLINFLGNYINI